jgi:hypothetical protein
MYVKDHGSLVQILNVQGNYWCTAAGTASATVHVYDSMLQHLTEDQRVAILCTNNSIKCKLYQMQIQEGTSDCGLLAMQLVMIQLAAFTSTFQNHTVSILWSV